MEPVKPVILWLADNPDWAYASIVRQVSRCLPGYRHEVYYLMHGPRDLKRLSQLLADADVVVPMYLRYHEVTDSKGNMALMLTGMRPFEPERMC